LSACWQSRKKGKKLYNKEELNAQLVPEQLSGVVERVAFHSEETGFSVLRVKTPGRHELATVVGVTALVNPGEHIECNGDWVNDRVHGLQFKAEQIKLIPPSSIDAIERYLCSGMVKGIGAHFAKVLIRAFGDQVFEVIENDPDRLAALPGIGPKRMQQIVASWAEQKAVRNIMIFLQGHGIGPGRAVRIYKTYGDNAIALVRENPYRLALDIHGIGFRIADALALRLGIERDAMMRARAGVRHVLQEISLGGHCAGVKEQLLVQAEKLLGINAPVLEEAVEKEVDAGHLIPEFHNDQLYLFLAPLHRAETGVARHVLRLLGGNNPCEGIGHDAAIEWAEQRTGLTLSESQQQAVRTVLDSKVSVITGGPGVGKTTVVNTILQIIRAKGNRVLLCAPTGRAAKRLSESTGLEARTIHRLLEFDPQTMGFRHDEETPLDAEFIVVDEASMVDVSLMNMFLQAVPDSAGLLIVGDVDQLPSVGPGSVLADIINSAVVPTARLTEIFRQAASSRIIVNAHKINRGELPASSDDAEALSDFYFIAAETPDAIHDKLMQLVVERIPRRFGFDPIQDIQVLTPMNKGGLGTRSLNVELQKRLNPVSSPSISHFGWTFLPGDKVIQTVNNYDKEVFNGDIGYINMVNADDQELSVLFDGRTIPYNKSELDELALAYATTIHKSQGSEYPAVVMPLSTQHYTLLERNLLYTGVTRGKQLVVIVGQPKALRIAVENVRSTGRATLLAWRIKDGLCD
jgi:exodeoxyribonuclease V alpha subunit